MDIAVKTNYEPENIMPDFTKTVVLTKDRLVLELQNMDTMDDNTLFVLVKDYYETMLNDIYANKGQGYPSVFTDYFVKPKFILTLTQVMYTISNISDSNRRRLNKITYDYLISNKADKDEHVSRLLIGLSKAVNKDKIPMLCAQNIPEDFASLLALSRYSAEKEIINVRRLDKVLMQQPLNSISEQLIVNIYLILFDHVGPLFTGVMLDSISSQNMTSNMAEIYGLITLAILDIFNELPIADIKKGLIMFTNEKETLYPDYPMRINLESFSADDYPRLYEAMKQLKMENIPITTR